jgi:4-hydroxy-2-oxoheptanedioate aldolase
VAGRDADAPGLWLSGPTTVAVEIAADLGYRQIVLDIEHGSFDLAALERFIPFCRRAGLEVLAKVLAPERGPIQQALDFGADAVVIPHVLGVEHAAAVTAFAKFPPLGTRSYAGGRTVAYQGPDETFFGRENERIRCLPMVETAEALDDIERILALKAVDGVFVGPSDLSLRRGRGRYGRSDADWQDLARIAKAAEESGKTWIMPAWTAEERVVARRLGAASLIVAMEHGALRAGLAMVRDEVLSETGRA